MSDLGYAEVAKLLKYEPGTGKLYWLARTPRESRAASLTA
jgi:hypothetical protein